MSIPEGAAWLFCPGDRPDRFGKAAARADVIILDLEDAVAPGSKDEARAAVESALPELGGQVVVRVNAAGTSWHDMDLAAVRRAGGTCVMLPKVAGPQDLTGLQDLSVVALCESATGVLNAAAIAAEANCSALFWGGEDLVADLGGNRSRDPAGRYYPVVSQVRATILLAAAAAGIPALDGVYLDIGDLDGLRAETEEAVDVGFAAKVCIHPGQVPVVREVFRPGAHEIRWAEAVLDGARQHQGGVFTHDGKMVDGPVLAQARRVLSRARRNPG